MQEALAKLLEIVDAPPTMTADLLSFMRKGLPHTAKKRAEIQKALIDHPDWSDTKIAQTHNYHLTGMKKEIEAGKLQRCPKIDPDPDPDPDKA